MQTLIDRRFYRHKYEAAKTISAFGATLHTETDLNELGNQLLAVIQETMQPIHVSLWLQRRDSMEAAGRTTQIPKTFEP